MANAHHPIQSFILIGAQKSRTTWLWKILKQHPDVALPKSKEINFFGAVEHYRKGTGWYYQHFEGLNPAKVTGEASPTYLYDYLPYWESPSGELMHDQSRPVFRNWSSRNCQMSKYWSFYGTLSPGRYQPAGIM